MSNFPIVVIRGAGDLASGVAYRLYHAGYLVVMTELEKPLFVRRAVSFGNAVFDETGSVEGIPSRVVPMSSALWLAMRTEEIPIIIDTKNEWRALDAPVVVDARMAKQKLDTTIKDAKCVIALGPGYSATVDCHAVIETQRGHSLGRVIWLGPATPNTGVPGSVKGYQKDRILRAPADGFVTPHFDIGDAIAEGDVIATVGDAPIMAPFSGQLRGLIHPTVPVHKGLKIGDLDPRGNRQNCFTISDKSLAIGGAVLMAILQSGIHPLPISSLVRNTDHAPR